MSEAPASVGAMKPRIQEIVVDCADPGALAEFWGTLLEAPWVVRDPAWEGAARQALADAAARRATGTTSR